MLIDHNRLGDWRNALFLTLSSHPFINNDINQKQYIAILSGAEKYNKFAIKSAMTL